MVFSMSESQINKFDLDNQIKSKKMKKKNKNLNIK